MIAFLALYAAGMSGLFVFLWHEARTWQQRAKVRREAFDDLAVKHAALILLLGARGITVVEDVVDVTDLDRAQTIADTGWAK